MGFFMISGFLIAQSYDRSSSLKSYFAKRIRRIYPGYLVATTFSGIVFIVLLAPGAATWTGFLRATALNLLLRNEAPVVTSLGEHNLGAVNGALWSIPFEFWCYIGIAILGLVRLLSRRWAVACLLITIMLGHVILDLLGRKPGLGLIGEIFGWPYLWTKMGPCFLLGTVAYGFRDRIPRSRALCAGLLISAVVACWIHPDLGYLLVLPSMAYGLFYFAYSEVPVHNAARFGDFSYGIYLYGFLIQRILQATIAKNWSVAEFFAVSSTLAIVAGFLSWHLIEKQWMRSGKIRARSLVRNGRARGWFGSNAGRGSVLMSPDVDQHVSADSSIAGSTSCRPER